MLFCCVVLRVGLAAASEGAGGGFMVTETPGFTEELVCTGRLDSPPPTYQPPMQSRWTNSATDRDGRIRTLLHSHDESENWQDLLLDAHNVYVVCCCMWREELISAHRSPVSRNDA
jgi:hypothetical protein